ncbi:surfeit locus protein 6 [Artemisia annua]|uniref:Surfeit locus protein 6 n=1 Tax=Artemisia annua TaxID=35608 RepID=A0A2U1P765_ARTAN|nr:surfeit locus protein 6 [Artemisia annua]
MSTAAVTSSKGCSSFFSEMGKKVKKGGISTASDVFEAPTIDLKTLIHDHAQFFDKLIELIPAKFYLPVDEDSKPWVQGLSKVKPMTSFDGETSKSDKSVTYEELQQRLHHKLEMLRSNRGQGKRTMMMNEVRQRPDFTDKKRKREDRDNSNSGKTASGSGKDKGKEKIEPDFEFGKLKLGDEDGSRKKAKKVSKVQELEKAKKLREAKTENVVVATKHSWKAATEKAMGGKVHDDPSRLKKSIQKDKKKRERSAGKWKERVETQDKLREEKQSKRRGNIDERANQKKARKIAKREKKLMRPGFEGKKEGYIGDK